MATPTSYPRVSYERALIKGVDSTPKLLLGVDTSTWVMNNISVCNTSENDIRINFYTLEIDNPENNFFEYNVLIPVNTSKEFSYSKTFLSGDIIYGYSDNNYNTFDCHISYVRLLETSDNL